MDREAPLSADDELDRGQNTGSSPEENNAKATFNTLQRKYRPPRPVKTFAGRMALYFALTAIMTAAIISAVLAAIWEQQFQGYTQQNMQYLAQQTAETLATRYEAKGAWTSEVYAPAITILSTYSGVGLQVRDQRGILVYDDVTPYFERSAVKQEDVQRADAQITKQNGTVVGTVQLWAFTNDALVTKADATLRANSYAGMMLAALIGIALAGVLGVGASRILTRPISVITTTAASIRNGDLSARTQLRGDDEIGRLGETFDGMASELERDIKFEHRLTSDVAHELRTPLMAMLVNVEAMEDGVLPADFEHLEIVAGEVRRLSRLVDAMLHLSRVENNENFTTEKTDMVYLVKSLVAMQEQLFSERELRLRFDDKTQSHELFADVNPDLIREAITNILSNAMRYTPAGGWVVVSIDRDRAKNELLISVQDTGIGIAKEDISRIFSRFWRSDASRERVSGGLGVGLAITKEIVDKHNGSIFVESELGKGTTFTLRIPIHRTHKKSIDPNSNELIG